MPDATRAKDQWASAPGVGSTGGRGGAPATGHDDDLSFARQVLDAEAKAIAHVRVDRSFHEAVELILAATGDRDAIHSGPGAAVKAGAGPATPAHGGSIVVSGMGKSGLIAQKISATFASTGTPSHFLHPSEAMHGDLGRVRRGDVVLILSYGGSTDEVVTLATILKQDGVPVIAMVGKIECDLGRLATLCLCVGDVAEACPLNLAPTASTTAMLALGDALGLAVSRRRQFGVDDFRKVHPGGGLGRQLKSVIEAMRFKAGVNLPLIPLHMSLEQAYAEAERIAEHTGLRRAGALVVVDDAGALAGIFTDGDLRRLVFQRHGLDVLDQPIENVMTRNPRRLTDAALVRDAVQMIREHRIDEVPVVDAAGKPLGLIDVQDLMALKVIEG